MPKFPFTNYHELNLDWILKKVTALFDASEENAQTIRTYETRLTAAEQTATSAATAATAAQQLADAASENADDALSVAGTADSKADSALTAATNAADAVAGALTIAQEAQQTAGAAVATANDAAATASSLESLANTANQNATAALETAQTADQKAVAALETAQTADQKAVAAQTAATTNAGNISTLQTDVSNLNRQLSDLESTVSTTQIINSASGAIASFDDGADGMPIRKLVAQIEPVQDLNGYDSPWPAGGGKNLCPLMPTTTVNKVTFTQREDGGYGLSGTADGNGVLDIGRGSWTLPAGTYYGYITGTSNATCTIWKIVNGTASLLVTGDGSFTLTETTSVFFRLFIGNGITASGIAYVQVESGSTATSFAPYSNICPISGWTGTEVTRTGENLCDSNTGEYDCILNGTGGTGVLAGWWASDYVLLKNGEQYTASFYNTNEDAIICFYDKNKTFLRRYYRNHPNLNLTFVVGTGIAENVVYARLSCKYLSSSNTAAALFIGDTAFDYETGISEAISVTFPSSAGTVYGGTLTINPDRTGTLVVDRACKTLTAARNLSAAYPGSIIYNASSPETSDANFKKAFICNQLRYVGTSSTSADWKYGTCINANGGSFNLWIKDSAFSNLEEATAWLESNETQICYELAITIEYELTESEISGIFETLYGQNNIWSDTGDTEVTYPADTKLYIEQLTKPTEDDMTANANIAANKFFMIGNTLYFSTAAIAAGATIIPGTNCNVVLLADALNNLNS